MQNDGNEKMYQKAKVSYDFENDLFVAIPLERKYDSSFQIGDFIFDLDKKQNVNGIELLNASKVFGIPKIFLKNMISGKLEVVVSKELIRLDIQIKSKVRNTDKVTSLSIERVRPEFVNPTELHLAIA